MIKIPLTKGKFALIDDDMWDRVTYFKKWHAYTNKSNNTYYAATDIRKTNNERSTLLMHQLVMGVPNNNIDHKDGNGLNNQLSNLRVVTASQNLMNIRKRSSNISKYKGVTWHKQRHIWRARITLVKEIYLGVFTNETSAAIAYNNAACKYFGEFARLNFISIWDLRGAV